MSPIIANCFTIHIPQVLPTKIRTVAWPNPLLTGNRQKHLLIEQSTQQMAHAGHLVQKKSDGSG